jgi:uronate dehydrogenase
MPTVLVTGATGQVARGVLPYLEKEFELRLLALEPPGNDPRRIQADVLDLAALVQAAAGADAVLHLAVAPGHSGTYEDDAFNDRRFDVNVKGTFHVFEAARRAKVPRVIYVSSIMATWAEAQSRHTVHGGLVPGDTLASPVGTYALTKALGEEIAWYYAVRHKMEVLVLRIAGPLDLDDPELRRRPVRPQQIPFPDLAQAFQRALRVPLSGFEIVTVTGLSARSLWDLRAARRVLGYSPQICVDELGLTFAEPFDVPP